jgi:hypothetical protein
MSAVPSSGFWLELQLQQSHYSAPLANRDAAASGCIPSSALWVKSSGMREAVQLVGAPSLASVHVRTLSEHTSPGSTDPCWHAVQEPAQHKTILRTATCGTETYEQSMLSGAWLVRACQPRAQRR